MPSIDAPPSTNDIEPGPDIAETLTGVTHHATTDPKYTLESGPYYLQSSEPSSAVSPGYNSPVPSDDTTSTTDVTCALTDTPPRDSTRH